MATAGKISATCACGKVFTGDAAHAGMTGKCEACGARVKFPGERAVAATRADHTELIVLRCVLYVVAVLSGLATAAAVLRTVNPGTAREPFDPTGVVVLAVALAGLAASWRPGQ